MIKKEMRRKFEVERILAKEVVNQKPYYLIQWVGYSKQDSTWEPIENVGGFKQMIRRFEKFGSRESLRGVPDIKSFVLENENKLSAKTKLASQQSSIEVLPNQGGVSDLASRSSRKISSEINSGQASEESTNEKVDNIMQPFHDGFQVLFNELKKKLKQDDHHLLKNINLTTKEIACQTSGSRTKEQFSRPLIKSLRRRNILASFEVEKDTQQIEKKSNKETVAERDLNKSLRKSIEKSKDSCVENNDQNDSGGSKLQEKQKGQSQTSKTKTTKQEQLGSFDDGNQLDHIVKGMEDQTDGLRKYLIRWKQDNNERIQLIQYFEAIKESWVREQVMLEFACKDLSKFFLSRIKWAK